MSQNSQNTTKLPAHCFLILQFILLRSKCVMNYYLHLFTIMHNYGLSSIAFYGWYNKFMISMAIALHGWLLYMSRILVLMGIQLWCLFGNRTNLFWWFWWFANMYMHSVSFFNANSTVMFVWWLNHLVLVILRLYIHSVLFCNVNSTVMSVWWL